MELLDARSVAILVGIALPVAFLAFGLLSSPQALHLLTRATEALAQFYR